MGPMGSGSHGYEEVSDVSTQFEFHLLGANAPDGELEADQLLSIVASLKEIATKIGRVETGAERLGRAPRRTTRIASLTIGLAPGSTRVLARRTGANDALAFDLAEEQAFDQRFADLVEAIALDERPEWVGDSLAIAAEQFTAALQQAAPDVEFKVAGQVRRRFSTQAIRRQTWEVSSTSGVDHTTFVGRLYAVNLNTHRLQVQDDVGNQVALPKVANDAEVSRLIGAYVAVTGGPEFDPGGRLTQIHDAIIVRAADPWSDETVPGAVPLEDVLRSAPGPALDGGIEMTDEEYAVFIEAARG